MDRYPLVVQPVNYHYQQRQSQIDRSQLASQRKRLTFYDRLKAVHQGLYLYLLQVATVAMLERHQS